MNYWRYNVTSSTTQLSMYLSDLQNLTGSYIGRANMTSDLANPFTLLYNTTQTIYVNTDEEYKTTIGVTLGYQGNS